MLFLTHTLNCPVNPTVGFGVSDSRLLKKIVCAFPLSPFFPRDPEKPVRLRYAVLLFRDFPCMRRSRSCCSTINPPPAPLRGTNQNMKHPCLDISYQTSKFNCISSKTILGENIFAMNFRCYFRWFSSCFVIMKTSCVNSSRFSFFSSRLHNILRRTTRSSHFLVEYHLSTRQPPAQTDGASSVRCIRYVCTV